MKTPRTRFWEPGFSIFTDELAKEERARLTPLKENLKKTDDPEARARLREEISKIKTEFREKRKSASRSLFARS